MDPALGKGKEAAGRHGCPDTQTGLGRKSLTGICGDGDPVTGATVHPPLGSWDIGMMGDKGSRQVAGLATLAWGGQEAHLLSGQGGTPLPTYPDAV